MHECANLAGIRDICAVAGCDSFAEAIGHSERAFRTHQERLVRELALAKITDMAAANQYLQTVYLPAYNEEFMHPASEDGSAFVACSDRVLWMIFCASSLSGLWARTTVSNSRTWCYRFRWTDTDTIT